MTTGLPDRQTDTTVPANQTTRSVSFFRTQEAGGDQPQFHVVVCDLLEGKLMRCVLERSEAQRLAQTIIAATGP